MVFFRSRFLRAVLCALIILSMVAAAAEPIAGFLSPLLLALGASPWRPSGPILF